MRDPVIERLFKEAISGAQIPPLPPSPPPPPPSGGGSQGSSIPPMEQRLTEVEKAIVRIDATLANVATKDEVQKGFAEMTKWIIGTGFAGVAVFITVMTFVLNNAVPKAPPVTAQPPIIINVPAAPAPAPAASR